MGARVWAVTAHILLVGYSPRAQVLEWARCYDLPGESVEDAFAVAVDETGHAYVTGASREFGGNPDYATLKYDADGDTVWVRRYNSVGNEFDLGRDLLPDPDGNLYVTGAPVTIKYTPEGETLWVYEHFGELFRLAFDGQGNIVGAGTVLGDIRTVKLSPDGALIWGNLYSGPANDSDKGNDLALDSEGNILVAGESWGLTDPGDDTQWNYTTLKYDPGGALLWARHYNGPADPLDVPSDHAFAVAVDEDDNVYVSGWSDSVDDRTQCLTIKYSPDGETLWERRYPESGPAGAACYDLLYDHGNLYAAARGGGGDTLLKYDLGGNLQWSRMYAHTAIFATKPPRLAADTTGNVYVTSVNSVGRADYVVLKYMPDGERAWEYLYPGYGENTGHEAADIAVDAGGNVYVTGGTIGGGACPGSDYLTLKLSQPPPTAGEPEASPSGFALGPAYPNPFAESTTISYQLPEPTRMRLAVYDVLGRAVAVLVDGVQMAGSHEAAFVAGGLPAGVYVYRLDAGAFRETRRMMVLK